MLKPQIQQPVQRHQWWNLLFFLLLLPTLCLSQSTQAQGSNNLIMVDGFVDTTTCYQHLVQADANGDGKLEANEFVDFAQAQAPPGTFSGISTYQGLPLVMQATFVTLTCLCRDPRFGGNPKAVDCCLGKQANIAIVGNSPDSTSEQRTRLFATCFLTDQAIVQVTGSESPSSSPTTPPTTALPSVSPTAAPTTASPTGSPTGSPVTGVPTPSPTANPTVPPSLSPTATPSSAPITGIPTSSPTTSPVIAPSAIPSSSPTVSPAPTAAPVTLSPTVTPAPTQIFTSDARVTYTIAVINGKRDGIPRSAYEGDLIDGMNQLANAVAAQQFGVRLLRRQLVVSLQLPTSIANLNVTECPPGLTTTNDRCENVEAVVTLKDNQELQAVSVSEFETALFNAIANGSLQQLLPKNTPVKILTGLTAQNPNGTTPGANHGLPGGATAGIVVGALFVALLPIALYVGMRRHHKEKDPYGAYEPHEAGSDDGIAEPEQDIEATALKSSRPATLGAKPGTYYGKDIESEPMRKDKSPPISPESQHDDDDDELSHGSSSNEGSSGWSSSAGLSSLNTGSADDSMDAMLHSPTGASLAAIAAASANVRKTERTSNLSSPRGGTAGMDIPADAVSRSDLDNAIEAGDWAAVGATAALLAAASDSQSQSTRSRTSAGGSQSHNTSGSSMDAARAAELDHLVDAGDWEGVVLAAAKFENQENEVASGSFRSGTPSSQRSSSGGSETRSGTGSGTYTHSVSTSVSESASKAQKRQEIRQEVVALVRRVVPEEIDNVDEMMLQFKGREEELVETLRTMQERAVAQKARTAGHKAAKQEARRSVQRGQVPMPPTTPTRDGQSSAGGTSDGTDESAQRKRTALEEAIEAGDWEAVGEAAAMMSDTSMTSASTAELERLTSGGAISTGSAGSTASPRVGGVNADRARALDELIDRGDWTAVVEAAGKFSQADKEGSDAPSVGSPVKRAGSQSGESESKRAKQIQEEENALAQAEIWMQIAEQSKSEGGNDAAASEAADWAIARSLRNLAKAEGRSGRDSSSGGKGPDKEEDDNESV